MLDGDADISTEIAPLLSMIYGTAGGWLVRQGVTATGNGALAAALALAGEDGSSGRLHRRLLAQAADAAQAMGDLERATTLYAQAAVRALGEEADDLEVAALGNNLAWVAAEAHDGARAYMGVRVALRAWAALDHNAVLQLGGPALKRQLDGLLEELLEFLGDSGQNELDALIADLFSS